VYTQFVLTIAYLKTVWKLSMKQNQTPEKRTE